jgi:hypothetical protein
MGGSGGFAGRMMRAKVAAEITSNRILTLIGIVIKKITIAINSV